MRSRTSAKMDVDEMMAASAPEDKVATNLNTKEDETCRFFELPSEIRINIYESLFVSLAAEQISCPRESTLTAALLYTNHKILSEAWFIFANCNLKATQMLQDESELDVTIARATTDAALYRLRFGVGGIEETHEVLPNIIALQEHSRDYEKAYRRLDRQGAAVVKLVKMVHAITGM